MKEWTTYHLEDICKEILSGGDAAKYDCVKAKSDTYKYPVFANAIDEDGLYGYCNDYVVNVPSVTIAARGAGTGYVAYRDTPYTPIVRLISLIPKDNVNPLFLYYRLKIANLRGDGSAIPQLTVPMVKKLKVTLPDHETQKTIADILRSLDVKIQLNKQINDNLEQQAQALYKSWFIDNYQTEWPEYSLDEVTLKITDGVHNTVIDTPNGEYYLLSCKNIKNRRLNISSSDRRIDEGTFNKLRKRTMLSKGDILLSSVGTIGELMLLNEDPHNYEFQRSVAIIKPNPVYISSYYLYETLISQIDKITNTAHGAVQQCIFLSDLKEYTINIADKALISRYDIIVKPFFDEITKREKEIARLTSLRNSLLPKLMSGELKINEIDC